MILTHNEQSMKRLTAKMQDGSEGIPDFLIVKLQGLTSCVVFLPPKDDINAPDLYIPVMSFVTYIITVSFMLGTRNA